MELLRDGETFRNRVLSSNRTYSKTKYHARSFARINARGMSIFSQEKTNEFQPFIPQKSGGANGGALVDVLLPF